MPSQMRGVVLRLTPSTSIKFSPPNGYYIFRSDQQLGIYLNSDGTWQDDCRHGWFATSDEALACYNRSCPPVRTQKPTNPINTSVDEDTNWIDRLPE